MPQPHHRESNRARGAKQSLQQHAYSLDEVTAVLSEQRLEEDDPACTSLIRTCEAWATEAFRLPADFFNNLGVGGGGTKR